MQKNGNIFTRLLTSLTFLLSISFFIAECYASDNSKSGGCKFLFPEIKSNGIIQGKDRPDLDASLIDKTLLNGADAVIRYQKLIATVSLSSGVNISENSAITVLSENGKSAGYLIAGYNRMEPLHSLKAIIYNSKGKFIKEVHERDFQDYSLDDGESMFNDERYKLYKPAVAEYPFTVVLEQESSIKNTLYLPSWEPQSNEGLAIEQSSFELHVKKDISLHFHQQGVSNPELRAGIEDEKIYRWLLERKPAFRVEPYGPSIDVYMPHVFLSADNFIIQHMAGSLSNWKTYGQFEYDNFLKNAAVLPQTTIDEVLALTAREKDEKEKARIIYQYMQQKTHYVGVQIGIGGIKTEKATNVDLKGYGDCKGLVNYTRALMKVCGINAIYAEVYAGHTPKQVFSDFASLRFSNHIILCLPFKTDTCWLECTSQKLPFNYQGNFTDNRPAILITPEGGKMVYTHHYHDSENRQVQNGKFILATDGRVDGVLETKFTGVAYQDRDGIDELTDEKKIEALKRIYPLNRLEITSCSFNYLKNGDPTLTEKLGIEIEQFALTDSSSLTIPINPFLYTEHISYSRHKRMMPIIVLRGKSIRNETSYKIPTGFKPDSLPEIKVHSDFGDYSFSCTYTSNLLTCLTTVNLRSGRWEAARFDEFVNFYQQLNAFTEQAIIATKTK